MFAKFWLEDPKERDYLEAVGVHWRIILNGSWGNRVGQCRLNSSG
jgi:hypothetical protein